MHTTLVLFLIFYGIMAARTLRHTLAMTRKTFDEAFGADNWFWGMIPFKLWMHMALLTIGWPYVYYRWLCRIIAQREMARPGGSM